MKHKDASVPDTLDAGLASNESADGAPLKRTIGAAGFFSLAFGAIVGSGWVVVLGEWLAGGGPGGVVVGFLAGGTAVMIIGMCYAELTARMPRVGGEFLYARDCIGPNAGFFVGWFLALYMISISAFEGIALALFVRHLVGSQGPVLYEVLGHPVTTGSLWIGLGGAVVIGALNLVGARLAIAFQSVVTFVFIGIILVVMAIAFGHGSTRNLEPLFPLTAEITWWHGAFWVFSMSGMFLNGFQAALHAIEERRVGTSLRRSVLCMVGGIGAAACFYCLIVVAAASVVPWRTLLTAELPAAAAFAAILPGGVLGTVVIAAAAISLVKTWNAFTIMASRLIYAQARLGYLPPWLTTVSRRSGVPTAAIVAVSFLTMLLIPLGRGAVLPIVNMSSMCLALSYVLCLWILLRLRRSSTKNEPLPAFVVPGGRKLIAVGLISAIGMAAIALVEPAFRMRTVPPEWVLIGVWGACGVALWLVQLARGGYARVV